MFCLIKGAIPGSNNDYVVHPRSQKAPKGSAAPSAAWPSAPPLWGPAAGKANPRPLPPRRQPRRNNFMKLTSKTCKQGQGELEVKIRSLKTAAAPRRCIKRRGFKRRQRMGTPAPRTWAKSPAPTRNRGSKKAPAAAPLLSIALVARRRRVFGPKPGLQQKGNRTTRQTALRKGLSERLKAAMF